MLRAQDRMRDDALAAVGSIAYAIKYSTYPGGAQEGAEDIMEIVVAIQAGSYTGPVEALIDRTLKD